MSLKSINNYIQHYNSPLGGITLASDGETMTYGEIAKIIAKEKGLSQMSAQAVGGAVGHNSISLIIPCHRVVGTGGKLTGYAGGVERKEMLLEMEKGK